MRIRKILQQQFNETNPWRIIIRKTVPTSMVHCPEPLILQLTILRELNSSPHSNESFSLFCLPSSIALKNKFNLKDGSIFE